MHQYREALPATALILAGGKATRLGEQDKGLIELNNRPIISNTINTLRKQVGNIIICANRNLEQYADFGLPVISDETPEFKGPLAGISAGMKQTQDPWLLVTPCDTPFIPDDLAVRLYYAVHRSGADIGVVHDGERAHYLHAMISTRLLDDLDEHLLNNKLSVNRWYADQRMLEVDFSDKKDLFLNINTPEDLQRAKL